MLLATLLLIVVIVVAVLCILAFSVDTTSTKSFTLSPEDESKFVEIETNHVLNPPGRFTPTLAKNHMVVKSLIPLGVSPRNDDGVIWYSIAPVTDTSSPVIDTSTRTFKVFNMRAWDRNRTRRLTGAKGVDRQTMAVSLPIKDKCSLFLRRNEPVKVSYHIELLLSTYDNQGDFYSHISEGVYLGFSTGGGNIIRVVRPSFMLSGATIFSGTFDFVPTDCVINAKHNCVMVDPVISVQAGNAPTAAVAVTILKAELNLENE